MERLLCESISSAVRCHPIHFASGASWVCRRTHFALFRWAITQRSLCLAPQRSRGLKISPRQRVIFYVISMGPPGMCICLQNHISLWRWQKGMNACAPRAGGFTLWVSQIGVLDSSLHCSHLFDGHKDNYVWKNCQNCWRWWTQSLVPGRHYRVIVTVIHCRPFV